MKTRIIVSGGDELRQIGEDGKRIHLEGAGALLAAGDTLFAASGWGNMIWRLDSRTLVPKGLFAGGPDVCRMLLSQDGRRLYALCAEADSLLMLDAQSGTPLLVNRAGVSPSAMVMDETGKTIAVAGGASGEILLMDAGSLQIIARLQTCGMTFGVLMRDGGVFALSLDETLNSVVTSFLPGGVQRMLPLAGMPGALAVIGGRIAAATHEGLFCIRDDGACVSGRMPVPGRAGRMFEAEEALAMTDIWSDRLYLRGCDGRWKRAAENARDAAVINIPD